MSRTADVEISHLYSYGTGTLYPTVCDECQGSGRALYSACWKDSCQDWEGWEYGLRRVYDVVRYEHGSLVRTPEGRIQTTTVGFDRVMVCRKCGGWGVVLVGFEK